MKIELIGFPMFYGCDRPGVEHGPDKLRENGLVEILKKHNEEVEDFGNIDVMSVDTDRKYASHKSMKYLDEVVDGNLKLAQAVEKSLKAGNLPFVVGGDHSLGLGSMAGVKAASEEEYAVIWIDAHADLNVTESSPSGNIHGMPLGASTGLGDEALTSLYVKGQKVKPENIYIIGLRSVDEGEEVIIREHGINIWRMTDIRERGMDTVIHELLEMLGDSGIGKIHLSYDIDSLDIRLVPGTGTPVEDGLEFEESKALVKAIISTGKVGSIDFVEFNPVIDKDDITLNSSLTMLEAFSEALGNVK
ncbi:arginase [Proteiniclasticum sp. SCR006]|uniref:Arginase n=1 Tax=Proteiniclasticum aestuarii TaxID=2817862 RepID=A0A939HAU0_9CLOT|nr:arginase [Proteiniclasticum aestuarii]MBO1263903.1 arginase [Proteiniclasticum aestuarii]